MKSQSPLNKIYKKGFYGDFENKNEENLIKIKEVSNLSIFQIVKYKNSVKFYYKSLNLLINNYGF